MSAIGRMWTGLTIVIVAWMAQPARAQSPEFHYLHGGQYEGVLFLDSDDGWIAGDGGRIRYTQDGGATWPPPSWTKIRMFQFGCSCEACIF